jgi:hypothetical protein
MGMKKLIVLNLLLILTACTPWINGSGSYQSPSRSFSIYIPDGWMRLDTETYLLVSKEGPFLQYVLVQDRHQDKPFRHTRRKMKEGMLPQEAAEVILNEISADRSVLDFEILENVPVTIDGQDGFRLLFTYTNTDGMKLKSLYYGVLSGQKYFSIRYTAASRYYFSKDIQIFEKILNSFRLRKPQPA